MKNAIRIRILGVAAAASAVLMLWPATGGSQTPSKERPNAISAAKAQNIAENFELNATTLAVFDRQGRVVTTVGPRAMYGAAAFSPDAKRMAVVKIDLENESRDVWVVDLATGNWTRITSSPPRERAF